ncbi:rhodopsin, GQ-coupled [Cimex lectularius]|uniref:G-protein coupled receptors family 1 profile domain-containing protein n=1 Tax=Cimex lectularius TaxID=79782 RepID=A0A8I6RMK0_CIMLE|nr:rhodopsin, GQ-coupled [Cimex lectularius]XP_014249083.1 rhodopsin, GQ-coupled [Cimex lectularius]XP_024081978.1 rhodopsin, GQ-coupled [Cimex lectularius]
MDLDNLANITESLQNATFIAVEKSPTNAQVRHAVITVIYFMGVIGNLSALGFLYASSAAPKNLRHLLVLKCLAFNDLLAVVGMWIQMNLRTLIPSIARSQWFCAFRVIWRCFGIGSGCIVCIMAIDRWIALTRPLFYLKHMTLGTIKKSLLILWAINLLIVCSPLFGFGLYFENGRCVRYKMAVRTLDRVYALVYFSFGFLLCCSLILCNLSVMKNLSAPKQKKKVLVRRISRNRDLTCSASTYEELAFARLMGVLCAVIIICWLPQLITIPISQLYNETEWCKIFMNLGDLIYAVHFTLDPYFYILLRWTWFKSLCRKKVSSRGNSTKTTQELCSL